MNWYDWSVGADRSGVYPSAHLGIGFLVATTCDDWARVFELCERASASESAAREAAKALKEELECVVLEFIEQKLTDWEKDMQTHLDS